MTELSHANSNPHRCPDDLGRRRHVHWGARPTAAARPGDPNLPAPGTRGNAGNVPFIGRSDPKGNPVRLAKSTGHVSNYSEDKVRPYTLPDPLVMANGERVASADQWFKARRPEILKLYRDEDLRSRAGERTEGDLGGDRDRHGALAAARRS